MNKHRVKALRITVRDTHLQQHRRELDTIEFVKANMWLPKHAFFLHEHREYSRVTLYVQLPSTHVWGRLAASTTRFLETWMNETLILRYEEGWLSHGYNEVFVPVTLVEPRLTQGVNTVAL